VRATGSIWESVVLNVLQQSGLTLLARNFTTRFGEIDLIMHEQETVVFIEVRYRDSAQFGDGVASINYAKQLKLIRAAQIFLQHHPTFAHLSCRFDVVGCSGTPQQPQLDWQRAAFDAYV